MTNYPERNEEFYGRNVYGKLSPEQIELLFQKKRYFSGLGVSAEDDSFQAETGNYWSVKTYLRDAKYLQGIQVMDVHGFSYRAIVIEVYPCDEIGIPTTSKPIEKRELSHNLEGEEIAEIHYQLMLEYLNK